MYLANRDKKSPIPVPLKTHNISFMRDYYILVFTFVFKSTTNRIYCEHYRILRADIIITCVFAQTLKQIQMINVDSTAQITRVITMFF